MRKLIYLSLILIVSCQSAPDPFKHTLDSDPKPWKHSNFDHADDKFTFAIFSDLTGGERKGIFSVAVEQLNLLRPELIVNVGDLVEGGSDDPAEWHRQWDSFDERADQARAPVFYAGGNHDLTGELARKVWKERLGPRYYHFVYKDVLFLVLDTEDNTPERMAEIERIRSEAVEVYRTEGPEAFSSTAYALMPERTSGTISQEQAQYIVEAIESNPDVRWTFIMIHKPAWEREDEQNFASIETALSDRSYTVFYGHTHVYKYEQRKGRDYINLATTGGEQFPEKGRSVDHLMLVTVDREGVTMANLLMEGIRDKSMQIPLGGDSLVFEQQGESANN
jgi:3',5'-cyclic AMP phosphodiesterase CpdA